MHCNSDAALTESTTIEDLDSTTVVTMSAPANMPGPQRSNGHAATHVNAYSFILVTMYVYIIM